MALAMDRAVFVAKRKALGLTQDKLSMILHVNIYTVKKWELGSRKIPPYMIYVFAALEAGIPPASNDLFPMYMLYAFAAIQAGIEPPREGVLIEVVSDTKSDTADI